MSKEKTAKMERDRPIVWGPKHGNIAKARQHEIVAERMHVGDREITTASSTHTEDGFRFWLDACAGIDDARIDREVRRVDRFARGVIVMETKYQTWSKTEYDRGEWRTREEARRARGIGGRIVCVTRIRKTVHR